MKTITFYSYKGGVGRSLALTNIAIRLSEFRKKVCVLDFDLEAPGLQFKFSNYAASRKIEKGIVDYIYSFVVNKSIPKNIDDFAIDLYPSNKYFSDIKLIPAGDVMDVKYWKTLSQINWGSMFYEEKGLGVKFFLDLKKKIFDEFKPDFLLIDSRTGITDISGITLRILADEVVILAANNRESIFGTKKIIKSLTDESHAILQQHPKVTFILTRVPFTDTIRDKEKESRILKNIENEFKVEISTTNIETLVIHSDRRLEEDEKPLIGDDYDDKSISISNDYLKLFDKLTNDILSAEEVEIFRKKRLAEREYNKALSLKDHSQKILAFTKAIELDSTQYEYYLKRADSYTKTKDYDMGLQDLNKALDLNPNSSFVFEGFSLFYFEQDKFENALQYINKAIKADANRAFPYFLKALTYSNIGNDNDAIVIYKDIVEKYFPESDVVLNSYADSLRIVGNYSEAFKNISKAIQLNPNEALYFGTLAEIYACQGKHDEFYLNLGIALAKGITADQLTSAKDVYSKFADDPQFIAMLNTYAIDLSEVLNDNKSRKE